jgi:LPS sulfotransferase NodH
MTHAAQPHRALDPVLDYPKTEVVQAYLILSSPRSGSTMLSTALASSKIAGRPLEYLNPTSLAAAGVGQDIAKLIGYLEDVRNRRTTPNGVFGMKLHFNQFANLFVRQGQVNELGVGFLKTFNKVILTHRHDKVLQAISLMHANRSKLWNSKDAGHAGSVSSQFREEDVDTITACLAKLVNEEASWRLLMAQLKLNCIDISYEDLCANQDACIGRAFVHLGLSTPPSGTRVQTVKLSDESNLQVKQDYLRAIGAIAG